MTPGAIFSTGRNSVVLISPFPSIGCPKAFITRPRRASPTGTENTCFVLLTISPSLIKSALPNKTAPTESSLRFITRPYTSWGNISNSPFIAFERP